MPSHRADTPATWRPRKERVSAASTAVPDSLSWLLDDAPAAGAVLTQAPPVDRHRFDVAPEMPDDRVHADSVVGGSVLAESKVPSWNSLTTPTTRRAAQKRPSGSVPSQGQQRAQRAQGRLAEQRRAEQRRAEQRRAEQRRAEQSKEQRPAEQSTEQRPAERPAEQLFTEQRATDERRPAARRPAGQRSGGQRSGGSRSGSARVGGTSLSAPQVGIAGALGLATIAAPISGVMAGPAPKADVNTVSSVSMAPAPAFPERSADAAIGVESLSVFPATIQSSAPAALTAPRTLLVTRASRSQERSVLPGCSGIAKVTDASNGQLPASSLCTLWNGQDKLRADAAVALAKLNIAYKQRFGADLCITDSYRTLSEQYRLRAIKPGLAAAPGTSEHGWGLAVDLCGGIERGSGSRYQWMRANAPAYGWDNPEWARVGGSGPNEPWHWEYVAGE